MLIENDTPTRTNQIIEKIITYAHKCFTICVQYIIYCIYDGKIMIILYLKKTNDTSNIDRPD